MSRLGWGIIGPGRIADNAVAPGINASPNSYVRGVVSRDQGRAEAFAAKHGAMLATTDYAALLADHEVDIVYIATPNAQHADQTIAALEAGKHVLCEKPLATTVADAERMLEVADRVGRKLGTGFQSRHHTAHEAARQLIRDGAIGEVILVQCESAGGGRGGAAAPAGWRADPRLAQAGALNNMAVHPHDLLRFLLNSEVVEVVAMNDCQPGDWRDRLTLGLFRFANGAFAYVNANQRIADNQPDIDIYGTRGRILGVRTTRPGMDGELRVKLGEAPDEVTQHTSRDAFAREVAAFNRAVLDDCTPNASGLDGLRSVQLSQAILTSIRDARRVSLTY